MGLVLGGCGGEPSPPRHLLLVTIDTLRPDHVGAYGYPRATSPRLDQLAETSVVFERAYGTSSWTLPSVASLLTAEYPSGHRCTGNRASLAPGFQTLAEQLALADFDTAAVLSHVFFARRYGLDQGFAHYDDSLVHAEIEASHRAVSSPEVTARALRWLETRAEGADDRRFFLWLHYFDPHAEYVTHESVTERFGDAPVDRYDGEIAFTDAHIGRVLDALDARGLSDDTLVVVVSDHGEAFGEHGLVGHRISLHEEELRVVLLVRAPGVPARRVATPVSLADVAPTALELLGVAPLPAAAGTSLVPALRGETLARPPILAELRSALDWRRVDAVIDGPWKWIEHRSLGGTLFDLDGDPDERDDRADASPETATRLRRTLRALAAAARARGDSIAAVPETPLDPEIQRQLEALGYGGEPGPEGSDRP